MLYTGVAAPGAVLQPHTVSAGHDRVEIAECQQDGFPPLLVRGPRGGIFLAAVWLRPARGDAGAVAAAHVMYICSCLPSPVRFHTSAAVSAVPHASSRLAAVPRPPKGAATIACATSLWPMATMQPRRKSWHKAAPS